MTVHTAIYLALFFIAMGCVARANLLFGDIVADINRLLPEERAISLSGFTRHRFGEILIEYRKLYPDGKLASRFYIWAAAGFASLVGIAGFWFLSQRGGLRFDQPADVNVTDS
jgi:hypothetical protein